MDCFTTPDYYFSFESFCFQNDFELNSNGQNPELIDIYNFKEGIYFENGLYPKYFVRLEQQTPIFLVAFDENSEVSGNLFYLHFF